MIMTGTEAIGRLWGHLDGQRLVIWDDRATTQDLFLAGLRVYQARLGARRAAREEARALLKEHARWTKQQEGWKR